MRTVAVMPDAPSQYRHWTRAGWISCFLKRVLYLHIVFKLLELRVR